MNQSLHLNIKDANIYMYMRLILKVVVVIIAILLISSAYVIFFSDEENNKEEDNELPTIDEITGNKPGTAGKIIIISVTFSDNIGVTNATLYYKAASASDWSAKSILTGSAEIAIPPEPIENWYYYVTVDDAAGNGPVGNPSTDGSIFYTITVSDNDQDFVHQVFLEEGTATWCSNCPLISDILYELYDSDDPDFYYVSMVEDMNEKANERLYDDYNIYGFPTVFFDGGYETCCVDVEPGDQDKTLFKEKIARVSSRDVPQVSLSMEAAWNENTSELTTMVTVENQVETSYKGRLKIYITEIISRWSDWNGNPFHFAFLDYAMDKSVEIKENNVTSFSTTWDASSSEYEDIYPQNLWIVAVLFNAESVQKYSDPSQNEYSFDAHFADAVTATRVLEGTLPPSIGISSPKQGMLYLFDRERRKTLLGTTLIIGKTTIKTTVYAEAEVEKVEFTIKGAFREITETVHEEPYEWTWHKFSFGRYIITVKLYDKDGRTATDSIDVIAFML